MFFFTKKPTLKKPPQYTVIKNYNFSFSLSGDIRTQKQYRRIKDLLLLKSVRKKVSDRRKVYFSCMMNGET